MIRNIQLVLLVVGSGPGEIHLVDIQAGDLDGDRQPDPELVALAWQEEEQELLPRTDSSASSTSTSRGSMRSITF